MTNSRQIVELVRRRTLGGAHLKMDKLAQDAHLK